MAVLNLIRKLPTINVLNARAMTASDNDERFDYRPDEPGYIGDPAYNESTDIADTDVDDSSFTSEEL